VRELIELTLGDGSVVKGANLEDAFDNLAKLKADSGTALTRDESAIYNQRPASEHYTRGRVRRRKRTARPVDLSRADHGETGG
jgi:hypothetical protein